MKIGALTSSISRNAGGLFESVRALNRATIQAADVGVEVFGLSDGYSENDLSGWSPMNVTMSNILGPAAFGFAPRLNRRLIHAKLDLIHAHGIWMYPSIASLRWAKTSGKPYIISPHGMLDPWAVSHSRWKKRLAFLAYEGAHLRGATCLRALCLSEAESMRAYGLHNPIAIIPNGVDLPNSIKPRQLPLWANRLSKESKVLFFLGRLHPKKGLPNLLHAWGYARQPGAAMSGDWHLVIAGWEEGGHSAELERLTEKLGLQSTVHFVGPQYGAEKVASFSRANAFVLPSFSEGLPMAVLEGWSYSLPVLMTSQCNLPEGFAANAAIRIEPEVSSITEGLRALFAMDDDSLQSMGSRGRRLAEQRFNWSTIGKETVNVYRWVLGQGPQPDCVHLK